MKRTLTIAAVAAICARVSAPIEANATVSVDPAVAWATAPIDPIEKADCYRLGEIGASLKGLQHIY